MENIKKLFHKYYEIIAYLFFGVLTTIVSFITFVVCSRLLNIDPTISNVFSWVISVTFAYITNRSFVFKSRATEHKKIAKEILSFFSARALSGILETAMIFIFVNILSFNDLLIKAITTGVVIVLNYLFSKIFVFKEKN